MSLKELYKKHGLCVAELILNERIYKTKNCMVIGFERFNPTHYRADRCWPHFHIPYIHTSVPISNVALTTKDISGFTTSGLWKYRLLK